jgi:chromosome segregation ATPase
MNIIKLELNYFQKHEHLELEFSSNVNVIYGKSDCGKSTIVRAIRWCLVPSELRGDGVRKEGSKRTSVGITFDNGAIVERIKTSSTNSYKLTIGNDVKEFNATGNNLPMEIQEIVSFKPIEIDKENIILNISNQLSMPFLLENSGTFRQKLLNKLIGNDKIDKAFQDLNKDILQVGRDEKVEKERVEELTTQLETTKGSLDKVTKLSTSFGEMFKKLKVSNTKLDKLTTQQTKLNELTSQLKICNQELKSIKLISKDEIKILEQKITKYNNLVILNAKWNKINKELNDIKIKLNNIKIPNIDTKDLNKKVDLLTNLTKLNKKLIQVEKDKKNIIIELAEITNELEQLENNYKKLLVDMKICPICKRPMDEKTIERMVGK